MIVERRVPMHVCGKEGVPLPDLKLVTPFCHAFLDPYILHSLSL
jgi:hypothetical protein